MPFEIGELPDERPAPAAGAARDKLLAHFAELDRLVQDDEFVRKTWREVARRLLAYSVKKAAEKAQNDGVDRVIEEFVGRYWLTAENRSWMNEILAMGQEQWQVQQAAPALYHRPSYRYTKI